MKFLKKHILEQYSSLLQEQQELRNRISKLEQKLERIRTGDNVKDAVKGGDGGLRIYHLEGYPTAEDDETTYLLNKNRRLLEERRRKIDEMVVSVEEFLNTMDDSRMRRMITYRLIDKLSWQQVAERMGKHYTEYSCKKQMERFLKEISKY